MKKDYMVFDNICRILKQSPPIHGHLILFHSYRTIERDYTLLSEDRREIDGEVKTVYTFYRIESNAIMCGYKSKNEIGEDGIKIISYESESLNFSL